jgi:hypothetical protein
MASRHLSRSLGRPGPAWVLSAGGLAMMLGCVGVIDQPNAGSASGAGSSSGVAVNGRGGGGPAVTGAGGAGTVVTGGGGSGTGGTGGTGVAVAFAPAGGAYRRLTATAFKNSLRDLLGGPVTVGELEPDSWSVGGFASVSAATVSISQVGVEDYQAAIDAATTQVFADWAARRRAPPTPPAFRPS